MAEAKGIQLTDGSVVTFPKGDDGYSPTVTTSKSEGVTTITITDASGKKTARINDGAPGKDGATPQKGVDYFDGKDGAPGKDGSSVTIKSIESNTESGGYSYVTFSDNSTLSIKNGVDGQNGSDGYTPVKGKDYFDGAAGKDGYTPVKGKDYFDGTNGKDGKDGTSVTHSWNGTTLSVTSASGTTSANLKGTKGDNGEPGQPAIVKSVTKSGSITTIVLEDFNGETEFQISDGAAGKDGTSVTVSKTTTSSADGGNNVVTFSDGKTLTVKNGTKGSSGKDGTSVTITNVEESTASGGSNVVTFSDGKTLTIKNGKDGTGGTGSGSSDWSVNDPNASGYVQNRTHWSEGTSEVLLASAKQVTADNGYISDTELLTVGAEYRVLYDGTEYHFTASEYTDAAGRKYVYCGNSVILSGNYDDSIWDDWFVIFNFNGKTFVKDVMIEKGLSTSATISMHGIIEIVHKLDEKYIPDTIARKSDITGGGGSSAPVDWSVNDPDAPGYIKNRTHWVEVADVEVFPLSDVEILGEDAMAILSESSGLLEQGKTYKVSWNGAEYSCAAQAASLEGLPIEVIGNGSMVGLSDTGEPFMIMSANIPEEGLAMTLAYDLTAELSSVALGIYENGEAIHKLDPKFYDQPCYDTRTLETLLDTSVYLTGSARNLSDADVRVGDELAVTFDGVEYNPPKSDPSGSGYQCIWGNPYLYGNALEDNGFPFSIFASGLPGATASEVKLYNSDEYDNLTVTLKVERVLSGEFKPLDDVYLPADVARKSDIKFESFGRVLAGTVLFDIPNMNPARDTDTQVYASVHKPYGLTFNKVYYITINGTQYTATAKRFLRSTEAGYTDNLKVNDLYIGADSTDALTEEMPFRIETTPTASSLGGSLNSDFNWTIYALYSGSPVSIKVTNKQTHIRELPTHYVPPVANIQMVSPNGTVYTLSVTNDGTLSVKK